MTSELKNLLRLCEIHVNLIFCIFQNIPSIYGDFEILFYFFILYTWFKSLCGEYVFKN